MRKLSVWIILAYTVLAAVLFLITLSGKLHSSPNLFFQDPSMVSKINETTSYDQNGKTVLITRLFHNKLIYVYNTFVVGMERAIDPFFIFSLTSFSMYGVEEEPLLPFFYFPFFLVAVWYLLKKKSFTHNRLILLLTVCAVVFSALFLPDFRLRYLPLVIMIHFITILGWVELVQDKRKGKLWGKR